MGISHAYIRAAIVQAMAIFEGNGWSVKCQRCPRPGPVASACKPSSLPQLEPTLETVVGKCYDGPMKTASHPVLFAACLVAWPLLAAGMLVVAFHLQSTLGQAWWSHLVLRVGDPTSLWQGFGFFLVHADAAHLLNNVLLIFLFVLVGAALLPLRALAWTLLGANTLSLLVCWSLSPTGQLIGGASHLGYALMALVMSRMAYLAQEELSSRGLSSAWIAWVLGAGFMALIAESIFQANDPASHICWLGHLAGLLAGLLGAWSWHNTVIHPLNDATNQWEEAAMAIGRARLLAAITPSL